MNERNFSITLIILGLILFLLGSLALASILTRFWRIDMTFVLWISGWFFGATLFFSGISKLVDVSRSD
ncbi:MAG: hypothetical protein ACTSRE_16110 [Promethearchaeota archaeon]